MVEPKMITIGMNTALLLLNIKKLPQYVREKRGYWLKPVLS
jgi:hypothetical protein